MYAIGLPSANQWRIFYKEWSAKFKWGLEAELEKIPKPPNPPQAGWSLACCLTLAYGWSDTDTFNRAFRAASSDLQIATRGNYLTEPEFGLIDQAWQHVGWRWQVIDLVGRRTNDPAKFADYDAGGEEVLFLLGACPGVGHAIGDRLPPIWLTRYRNGSRFPQVQRYRLEDDQTDRNRLILDFGSFGWPEGCVPRRIG